MSIARFLIKMLAGYDVLESENKLRLSWSRAIKDFEDQKKE